MTKIAARERTAFGRTFNRAPPPAPVTPPFANEQCWKKDLYVVKKCGVPYWLVD